MPVSIMTRSIAPVLAAALFTLLTACAGTMPERGIVDAEAPSEDEGIVFGMLMPLHYDSRGKQLRARDVPDVEYEVYFGIAENLAVRRVFSGFGASIVAHSREPQTFFAMKLPVGEYSLFKLHRPLSGTSGIVPTDVRFTVAPNTATYIGSLQIDFRATRGLLGEERNGDKVTLKVIDDAASATRVYKERNPGVASAIATNLMTPRRP